MQVNNVLMAAAENGLIKGGKVGGVADVIAGICPALAQTGVNVQIILPSYGALHKTNGFKKVSSCSFEFQNKLETVELYCNIESSHLTTWIVDHQLFAIGGVGQIYCDDPPNRPFATDATKFAFFSNALAQLITEDKLNEIQHIHLHDWQLGFLLFLREHDRRYQQTLSKFNYIFSIHNLAYQGIRPLVESESSLQNWWPDITHYANQIIDPRWQNCVNPMRIGITMADKIHTVSPSYAQEIQRISEPENGFYGGEGLEEDINLAANEQRLTGILNGCLYGVEKPYVCEKTTLYKKIHGLFLKKSIACCLDRLMVERLEKLVKTPANMLITSVGRITSQKMGMLLHDLSGGQYVLEKMLERLSNQGILICLGTGSVDLEARLKQIAQAQENFIFINSYSNEIAELLYANGDLFLMPSQFEPCGISQMLAMRAGQPCLAHAVGGLKDTIIDNENGFLFAGENVEKQAENLLEYFANIITLRQTQTKQWENIKHAATRARFTWQQSAISYIKKLYT